MAKDAINPDGLFDLNLIGELEKHLVVPEPSDRRPGYVGSYRGIDLYESTETDTTAVQWLHQHGFKIEVSK